MKSTTNSTMMNDLDEAVLVADPKNGVKKSKPKTNTTTTSQSVNQHLSPSSDGGEDVASKLSDLSESSTDNGQHPEDDRMMMTENSNGGNGTTSSSLKKNKHKLRSERSEDYENFEKMLRNKHSKACKAMSVRFSSLSSSQMFYCISILPYKLTLHSFYFFPIQNIGWCVS
jgi:hypothetical protein